MQWGTCRAASLERGWPGWLRVAALVSGRAAVSSARLRFTRGSGRPLRRMRLRDEQRGLGGGGRVRPGRAGPRGCAGKLQGHGTRRHYAYLRRRCKEPPEALR